MHGLPGSADLSLIVDRWVPELAVQAKYFACISTHKKLDVLHSSGMSDSNRLVTRMQPQAAPLQHGLSYLVRTPSGTVFMAV